MSWIQVAVAVPAALLVLALVHDFLAGRGEERLWSDPAENDPESFAYRATAAEMSHRHVAVDEVPAGCAKVLALVPQT